MCCFTELERVQSTGRLSREEKRTFADITKEKPIKVSVRVLVPIREHPKVSDTSPTLAICILIRAPEIKREIKCASR